MRNCPLGLMTMRIVIADVKHGKMDVRIRILLVWQRGLSG